MFCSLLWARLILRYFRVSSLHPIHYSINSLINPVLRPIDALFGLDKKRISRYDWVGLGLILVVECLKFIIINLLFISPELSWFGLSLYILADLIIQPSHLLFYAILIRVIISWIKPNWQHPIVELLHIITEPLFV